MIRDLKDYTPFELEQWGSHKEVILDIIEKEKPNKMLEIGAGDFSTPVYAPLVKDYISVETNEEWYNYIANKYPYKNITYYLVQDKGLPDFLSMPFFINNLLDIALVDHTHDTVPNQRATISNQLMKLGCKHIIIHDFCQDMIKDLELNNDYEYFTNSKSVNPSLYLKKR